MSSCWLYSLLLLGTLATLSQSTDYYELLEVPRDASTRVRHWYWVNGVAFARCWMWFDG